MPGATRSVEIAPGAAMAFCYIPPGEAQLGSPEAERNAVLKALGKTEEPEWLASEAERARGKYESKGFWLGKYPVTQDEWTAVMGTNPSYFDGKKDNKAKGMETGRFPVETVSWDMICGPAGFLERTNGHGGIGKAFGTPGKFRLPHENEWEDAYRGGKENKRAYYWGNTLTGTEANCDGNVQLGTNPGAPLGRTCAVEFTNNEKCPAHPWGLMHMSGNVYQLCSNEFSKYRLVVRGGSWHDDAHDCRGAHRNNVAPGDASGNVGFRVCCRLD